MFIQLLIASSLFLSHVQSAVTNSSTGQPSDILAKAKQASIYDDYDLNDKKSHADGSAASIDEYADEEDDDALSKSTTTTTTTIATSTTTRKIPVLGKKNESSTATDDLALNEFTDDYKDDFGDDVDYNEVTTEIPSVQLSSTPPPSSAVHRPTSLRVLFSFLTRPPIAAGILAGLAIGILTSVILLVCLVKRFRKRERTHSSYTTGLLYPNQYGYSKSPQEFYA